MKSLGSRISTSFAPSFSAETRASTALISTLSRAPPGFLTSLTDARANERSSRPLMFA